jgi:hypothetical protein
MALEVSMTGTGSIGDIAPGWSINEFATSNIIGSTGSGTGSGTFTAKALDESLLCINNNIQSTVDPLGYLGGVVQSVNQSGLTCSITHGSELDKFNLDVSVPPVGSGGTKAWFYKLCQAIGLANPDRPDYRIPSYAGPALYPAPFRTGQYSYGFPFDVNTKDNSDAFDIDSIFSQSTRSAVAGFGFSYENLDESAAFTAALQNVQTQPSLPGLVQIPAYTAGASFMQAGNMIVQFMLKVDSITDIKFWIKMGGVVSAPLYENMLEFRINGTSDTASIMVMADESTQTASLASLNHADPILVTFYSTVQDTTTGAGICFKVIAEDSAGVTSEVTSTAMAMSQGYGQNYYIAGDYLNASLINYVNIGFLKLNSEIARLSPYITPEELDYGVDVDFTNFTQTFFGAYPSTKGVAWELMQQIGSAENFEIVTSGNTVVFRDVALTELEISNTAPTPTINPTSTLSGRQINIPYTEAYFVEGVVYDSRADGNNILSVAAGETITTVVNDNVHPISLIQPRFIPGTQWSGLVNEYCVMDSTGYYLNAAEWTAFGGDVSVQVAPDDPAGIEIAVKGPYTEVTLAGGPYRIAVSDGSNEYASLKVGGTGVYSGDNVLELRTGLDPEKYTRATVNTITNPFINTLEQAYDRGVWASNKASGPAVTLTATIPTRDVVAIGLTSGSLINYNQSTYRVTSDTVSNVSTSLNAEYYVTVDDVDALWDGGVVNRIFTVTIASPAVFTSAGHGLANGTPLQLSTTGALPNRQESVAVTSVDQVQTYTFRYYCANNFYEGQTVAVTGYTGPYASLWNRTTVVSAATSTYFEFYAAGDVMYPAPGGSGTAVGYAKLEGGYVINSATNTFEISRTVGGAAVNTIGSQSGTHTATTSTFSVADYDALWGAYECQDQIIFPYKVA